MPRNLPRCPHPLSIWQLTMPEITATAPGKVILFGEHAVVYQRPAIAVPVLHVRANATLAPAQPGSGLTLHAPDLARRYTLAQAAPDDPLALIIRNTLRHFDQPEPDAALTVSSAIPLGRGLGSGAAISTAIARVLAQYLGQTLPPAALSALVFEVEKLYHGTPSGVDNTVIAFEQPVYFTKNRPIQRIRVGQPFTLVIGDTGIPAPTHKVVGDLRGRWQANPIRYEGYFDEIEAIATQARVVIEQAAVGLSAIGKLMAENHALLQSIGVSSPELDGLVDAARQAGALGAKLSGAGWGGNMIALAPNQPRAAETIAAALTQAGAVATIITTVR
jgi:mevalonate kinase